MTFFQQIRARAQNQGGAIAIHPEITYSSLWNAVLKIRNHLVIGNAIGNRCAILSEKGLLYVSALLGCFYTGLIAVPLCTAHPTTEMVYALNESESSSLLYSKAFESKAMELKELISGLNIHCIDDILSQEEDDTRVNPLIELEDPAEDTACLIMFTSGSTGSPKGVVHTISSLESQMKSLQTAWRIKSSDHILHILPLHHIHGIVNALLTILYSGGRIEFIEKFHPLTVWKVLKRQTDHDPPTLFMAVPTIYSKLISQSVPAEVKGELPNLRLCVSGSASLPSPIRYAWQELTGHVLLERYGMTEIGMALSHEMEYRIDSSVGVPLPNVTVKLIDEKGMEILEDDVDGEIHVKSTNLFKEYYNRPDATAAAFDGQFFKTGDIAHRSSVKKGAYFIQGRSSVDIIKTGGYKVSALEVEKHILSLPGVNECAVVGVNDQEWGQKVAAIVILAPGFEMTLETLRSELKIKCAVYKVPTLLKIMEETIPRNAMGKFMKKELVKFF